MNGPLVSVVIPLHNAEEWIEETIRSVLSQTAEPGTFDAIVVDNGSTDRSAEVARGVLAQSGLGYELVAIGENRGPGFARNAGWARSRAPWIQFLDSDDLLAPEKIGIQLAVAAGATKDVAAVYSEWQAWEQDGAGWKATLPVRSPALDRDTVLNLLEDRNFVHTGSQLFRRSWLEKVGGFDARWWLIEDVDLNLRLSMAGGRFVGVPGGRALFYYRRRPRSLSRSRRGDFLAGCVRNLKLAENHWLESGSMTAERREFLLGAYEPLLHNLAPVDEGAFEELLGHVRALSPGWLPRRRGMQLLSRFVGYRAAERLSMRYRELKGLPRRVASA